MNMLRKLALNLARIYTLPLSHILFDCLMYPHHLLTVLDKN